MLRAILQAIEFLIEEITTYQLTSSVVLGMLLGLIPFSLHWCLLLVCMLIFRFNLVVTCLSSVCFNALSYLIEPYLEKVGSYCLTSVSALIPIWAWMHHAPILPYTRFNNTVVFGSTLFAFLLAGPFFFLTRYLISRFRADLFFFWKGTKLSRYYAHFRHFN